MLSFLYRMLKKTSLVLLGLSLLLSVLGACLWYSSAGLYVLASAVNVFSPFHVSLKPAKGANLENLELKELIVSQENLSIRLQNFSCRLNWQELLHKKANLKASFQEASLNEGLVKLDKGQWTMKGQWSKAMDLTSTLKAFYQSDSLLANFTLKDGIMKANLSVKKALLEAKKDKDGPWQFQGALPALKYLHPALSSLDTAVEFQGHFQSAESAVLNIHMKPGNISIQKPTQPSKQKTKPQGLDLADLNVPFTGAKINLQLLPHKLTSSGEFVFLKDKKIKFWFELPQFSLESEGFSRQKLQGALSFKLDSLSLLAGLHPLLNPIEGSLQTELLISGTLQKPLFRGKLQSQDASLPLPQLGIALKPIVFDVKTQEKNWSAKAKIMIDDKSLLLEGKGQFFPSFTGLVHLRGQEVKLINKPEYQIFVSPDLSLKKSASSLALKGKIIVPKAEIKPQNFTDTTTLSKDAVFVNDQLSEPEKPHYLDMESHISLEAGNAVHLEVKGLKGLLRGKIDLEQKVQQAPEGRGELTIVEGSYKAYGQDLSISKGQFIFNGPNLSNPRVEIRAVKKLNNLTNTLSANAFDNFKSLNNSSLHLNAKTTLGIEVKGPLDKLRINLFSIPANLSQTDILSLLLLGKPAPRVPSQDEAQLLFAAVSALNANSDNKGMELLAQLKQSMGIDFNIENREQLNRKTGKANASTNIVLGKALSDRLYLSYNRGISQSDNTNQATLRYLLNQFFSLQVSASTNASGIDLLYTREKD